VGALLAGADGVVGDQRIGRLALRDGNTENRDRGHAGGDAGDFREQTHDERSLKLD